MCVCVCGSAGEKDGTIVEGSRPRKDAAMEQSKAAECETRRFEDCMLMPRERRTCAGERDIALEVEAVTLVSWLTKDRFMPK